MLDCEPSLPTPRSGFSSTSICSLIAITVISLNGLPKLFIAFLSSAFQSSLFSLFAFNLRYLSSLHLGPHFKSINKVGNAATVSSPRKVKVHPTPQASIIYCTTAVPAALTKHLVRFWLAVAVLGLWGYKSTSKVLNALIAPVVQKPLMVRIISDAANEVRVAKTQPQAMTDIPASIAGAHTTCKRAFSIGNFLRSSPFFRSTVTPMLRATRA